MVERISGAGIVVGLKRAMGRLRSDTGEGELGARIGGSDGIGSGDSVTSSDSAIMGDMGDDIVWTKLVLIGDTSFFILYSLGIVSFNRETLTHLNVYLSNRRHKRCQLHATFGSKKRTNPAIKKFHYRQNWLKSKGRTGFKIQNRIHKTNIK
jgi:hypothetical protein